MNNIDIVKYIRIGVSYLALILFAMVVSPQLVRADGTEMLDVPSIDIFEGTGVRAAGTGLEDGQPGTITIELPIGVTIIQVILYWAGNNSFEDEVTDFDTIVVDGDDVEGEFIGGNTGYSDFEFTVTYRADITEMDLVSDGISSFDVAGLDFTEENYGAGIMVVYDDETGKSQIDVRDGNDFAMINWPVPLDSTEIQIFEFEPENIVRVGNLELFVGSVADDTGVYGFRPSSFEVTVDGVTSIFSDQLNSNDGRYWDTVNLVVEVPAGAETITAQIFSRDDEVFAPGNLPASLVWLAAGFSIEEPAPDDCWITTGGFHNAGDTAGSKDYTFGGNVGPPPRGSWEVVDHNTGDNFHSNDVQIVHCEVIQLTGPGQPGGKKGFKINQASFEGTGRLNGEGGYIFTGYVQDAGEPHGKKANDQDFFSITVRDPDTLEIVFHASATLDGGNVQIHPPTGKFKK
ncbi:MAG: hypothetical protein COA99_02835 [Moraxellaceae bacterium]|nr:MAG: hypothetical protein COA99_02835 [Moraxellaceae bacterium]